MTLIELLVFLGGAAIAVGTGIPLAKWADSIWIGVAGGIGCTILVFTVFWGLTQAIYKIFPLRPICRRGKCHADDYNWDEEDFRDFVATGAGITALRKRGTIQVCKCGDRYLHEGRHFYELLADGSKRLYMDHPPLWRRWRKQSDAEI